MPPVLLRLYINDVINRTSVAQVNEPAQTFFELFKNTEPSPSVVLNSVTVYGQDLSGQRVIFNAGPSDSVLQTCFNTSIFPGGQPQVEYYASGMTGSGSFSTNANTAVENHKVNNNNTPLFSFQFGSKSYPCESSYFVGSYDLFQDFTAAFASMAVGGNVSSPLMWERKMSSELYEQQFPPLEDTSSGLQSPNACGFTTKTVGSALHPSICIHLDKTGLQCSVRVRGQEVKGILFRRSPYLVDDLSRFIKRYDKSPQKPLKLEVMESKSILYVLLFRDAPPEHVDHRANDVVNDVGTGQVNPYADPLPQFAPPSSYEPMEARPPAVAAPIAPPPPPYSTQQQPPRQPYLNAPPQQPHMNAPPQQPHMHAPPRLSLPGVSIPVGPSTSSGNYARDIPPPPVSANKPGPNADVSRSVCSLARFINQRGGNINSKDIAWSFREYQPRDSSVLDRYLKDMKMGLSSLILLYPEAGIWRDNDNIPFNLTTNDPFFPPKGSKLTLSHQKQREWVEEERRHEEAMERYNDHYYGGSNNTRNAGQRRGRSRSPSPDVGNKRFRDGGGRKWGEAPGGIADASTASDSRNSKARMQCPYFRDNICLWGKLCRYDHPVVPRPPYTPTRADVQESMKILINFVMKEGDQEDDTEDGFVKFFMPFEMGYRKFVRERPSAHKTLQDCLYFSERFDNIGKLISSHEYNDNSFEMTLMKPRAVDKAKKVLKDSQLKSVLVLRVDKAVWNVPDHVSQVAAGSSRRNENEGGQRKRKTLKKSNSREEGEEESSIDENQNTAAGPPGADTSFVIDREGSKSASEPTAETSQMESQSQQAITQELSTDLSTIDYDPSEEADKHEVLDFLRPLLEGAVASESDENDEATR